MQFESDWLKDGGHYVARRDIQCVNERHHDEHVPALDQSGRRPGCRTAAVAWTGIGERARDGTDCGLSHLRDRDEGRRVRRNQLTGIPSLCLIVISMQ